MGVVARNLTRRYHDATLERNACPCMVGADRAWHLVHYGDVTLRQDQGGFSMEVIWLALFCIVVAMSAACAIRSGRGPP